MLKLFTYASLLLLIVSCSDDTKEVTVDLSLPQGNFSVERAGTIAEQNDTGSKGLVQLGRDSEGTSFLHFGSDFETVLATGTVTVYLSTSDSYTADPENGNPDLIQVGPVLENGEMYFKLNGMVPSSFTHVILWCASAQIPFGNAALN